MIEWLKNWTNSIIVAVVIAVIFELIIPSCKNKKYIKMVINLYVLFVILNPLISKFTNLDGIDINTKSLEKYIKSENVIDTSASLDSNRLINNTAEKTLKENIKNKLKSEGYNVTSISINIDNKNGKINSLNLFVEKLNESKNENNTLISINEVEEVSISNKNENKKNSLRKSEIQKLKKLISSEYEITEENIEIN